MFRPICSIGHRISVQSKPKEFIRNKVVRPASILQQSEKIKLYNKENKELFGPLLETRKQKNKAPKTAKNSKVSHQNTESKSQNGAVKCKNSVLKNAFRVSVIPQSIEVLKRTMWQNTRACTNLAGVLLSNAFVRSFKTAATCYGTRSSPAVPGYSNEDRILQIKQRQNDYAQQYPSVTLILNKTMTDESRIALDKWKQERIEELGEEEFKRFYQAQMAVGTKFHRTLKDYFTQPQSQLRLEKDVEGVWVSVADVLKRISSPKAIESNVVHPVLKYRGIFDAIADYEDKPMVIEWKKSDKPRKSILLTHDNPVQLAAYFGAVCNDLNYKHLNVRNALLVIAYTDGSKADVYHLSTDKLREHWAQWLMRLETFMKTHGQYSEKILKGGKRLFEEDIGNLQ